MIPFHRCLRAALVASFLLAAPVVGHAQGKGDGPPPAADPAKLEEAKKHMVAGAALYNDPSGRKCEEAYVEFNKAFELSGSLNALKNRANCALELEKDGEALADYKKVLAGIGDKLPPDEKTQMESDVRTLEASVAWITIKLDVPKVKIVDVRTPSRGLPVTNRYDAIANGIKIGLHPGEHALTASTEDGKEVTWKVELTNGTKTEHTFEMTKTVVVPTATAPVTAAPTTTVAPTATASATEVPMSRPAGTPVKVMAGVTGALAIGAGVLGGLALATESDFKSKCPPIAGTSKCTGDPNNKTLTGLRSNVTTMNLTTDILIGTAGAAAVTTLILFLTRPSVKAEEATKSGFFIAPSVTPSAGGVVVGGRF